MKKILCAFCLTVSALGLTACGIGDTNTTYQRYEIGQQGVVSTGQIIAINQIQTAGQNDIGSLGGAIAGGAAGSMIGGNTAVNIIGATGGAILGGLLGSKTQEALTKDMAYEFIVRKSNGQMISIVQSNELHLRVGDQVLLSTVNGTTRIRQQLESYPY